MRASPSARLDWLAGAFAHRGLHDMRRGIVENTAPAFAAAIAAGYGIEADIQAAAGGEAVVFHDESLDRLAGRSGAVRDYSAAWLAALPLTGGGRILTLGGLLDCAGGRVPLLLEIKAAGMPDPVFLTGIAQQVRRYRGPVAVMSFNPHVLTAFRALAPATPRGFVTMRHRLRDGPDTGSHARLTCSTGLAAHASQPGFIACRAGDIAALGPQFRRLGFDGPLLAWTVRTQRQHAEARLHAGGIIFERIRPPRPLHA